MDTPTTSEDSLSQTQLISVKQPEDVGYILCTDGSGYTDHLGGFGAIALSTKYSAHCYINSCGCSTHTETGRAEFLAVLTGLHSILDANGWDKESKLDAMFLGNKMKVHVVSDRADLVGSINNFYTRGQNADLWQQFAWYEKYMDISAEHVKRETHPTQSIVDKTASLMRVVLKDFVESQQELKHI